MWLNGLMTDPWIAITKDLPLSRAEREIVRRYEADPEGRAFLPLADILRAHRLANECLELLLRGVERHPQFTVARIVLVRELTTRGLIGEAWRHLSATEGNLHDNVMAQRLKFRLAILRGDAALAESVLRHLKLRQMLDGEGKRLTDQFELTGLGAARDHLLQEYRSRGIEPDLATGVLPPPPTMAAREQTGPGELPAQPTSGPHSGEEEPDDATPSAAHHFHVMALSEVFRPGDDAAPMRTPGSGGLELDSTTLADIYARQGHYAKALSVYRRLLRAAPTSELLRLKVAELARLEREQRDADLSIDPVIADQMETLEVIDRQMRFYSDLLARLSS